MRFEESFVTMVVNVIIRRMAGVFAAVSLLATAAALEMPPDVEEAFGRAKVGESGGMALAPGERELVTGYVRTHWRELLDHLDEVPSRSGSVRAATSVVGLAAEDMPPMEYLDFLDHFLTVYAAGKIRDNALQAQLAGTERKNYFITVNSAHPRVQALLLRAKELVPKENVAFQTYLDEDLRGEGSDMYMANEGENALPPETLPGIKLRPPFESLIEKAKRLGYSTDAAGRPQRPVRNGTGESGAVAGDPATEGTGGGGRVWGVAAAMAVLAISLWRAFFRRRLAGASR